MDQPSRIWFKYLQFGALLRWFSSLQLLLGWMFMVDISTWFMGL